MRRAALALAAAALVVTSYAAAQSSSTSRGNVIPKGTVALPGLYVSGDRNTGFYQAAGQADTLGMVVGGVEYARLLNGKFVVQPWTGSALTYLMLNTSTNVLGRTGATAGQFVTAQTGVATGSAPAWYLNESDAAAGGRGWELGADNDQFVIRPVDDTASFDVAKYVLKATRTSGTRDITSIALGGPLTLPALNLSGDLSAPNWGSLGIALTTYAGNFTDTTSSGAVAGNQAVYAFRQPTIVATNPTTYSNSYATVYIDNAPAAGANVTFSGSPRALLVGAGSTALLGGLVVQGSTASITATTTTLGGTTVNVTATNLQRNGTAAGLDTTFTAVYDPVSLAAGSSRCDDVTVTGITTTGGAVSANIGAVDPGAGCVVASVRASASNTVRVCWRNAIDTVTACDTASSTWKFTQAQ